jgi:hypothetical protein
MKAKVWTAPNTYLFSNQEFGAEAAQVGRGGPRFAVGPQK